MTSNDEIKAPDWIIFIGLSIIWGFSFFFIKKGLLFFNPIQVAALRMSIAFLALTPFILLNLKKIKIEPWQWKFVPLLGLFGNLFPALFFCFAQTKVASGLVGIMNATTPLFVMLLGALFFGVPITKNKISGVLIGFFGAGLIILSKTKAIHNQPFSIHIILPLLATMCYGLNANIFKKYFQNNHPLIIALVQYSVVALVTIPYLIFSGTIKQIQVNPIAAWQSLKYLLLLGVLGTGMAQVFFNILTQRTSALFATMTTYLIPIVSVIIGLFIGEQILIIHIIALFIILIGVYFVTRKRKVVVN
ncbi:MAG: DMT family transporter [Chitinophagales bacterium]